MNDYVETLLPLYCVDLTTRVRGCGPIGEGCSKARKAFGGVPSLPLLRLQVAQPQTIQYTSTTSPDIDVHKLQEPLLSKTIQIHILVFRAFTLRRPSHAASTTISTCDLPASAFAILSYSQATAPACYPCTTLRSPILGLVYTPGVA